MAKIVYNFNKKLFEIWLKKNLAETNNNF